MLREETKTTLIDLCTYEIISDDELRQKIINGELVDEKLEATLFPNGKPSK